MLCSVYTTIAGEYDGPGFCTPIGSTREEYQNINTEMYQSRKLEVGFLNHPHTPYNTT